jgi:type I site-specific restriction endonuclease
MPIEQLTVWPTEADFEADLQAALRHAFPWLPTASIRHQTKFSFTFGRSEIRVDGRTASRAAARADVLLYFGEQPIAVLELKRPGHPIIALDIAQGLSYARMLHPRPPLVAVTNGSDLTLLETHTGNEWIPSERSRRRCGPDS